MQTNESVSRMIREMQEKQTEADNFVDSLSHEERDELALQLLTYTVGGFMFTQDCSTCIRCGNYTPSGMMHYCSECIKLLGIALVGHKHRDTKSK